VRVEASTALSKDEVEKLKREAAEHAAEDSRKHELAEAHNQAESTTYLAEKTLKDAGDKVAEEAKSAVNAKIENLKKVLRQAQDGEPGRTIKDGSDIESIKSATAELSAEIQKIGQAMYNKGNDQNAPGPEPTEPKSN